MSRSRRHTPILSWCSVNAGSQKWYKESENRAKRHFVKQQLLTEQYEKLPDDKEYGNEWNSPRDGKTYFGTVLRQPCIYCRWGNVWHRICECTEKEQYYKELMRK